ncbi:unnamed protein product [Durusdinium trenchii]|uniref:EF-hand domain-containing protein n=2 Tax=Durusdinium trenchii TaxID=1381693 RepID=A0ABP0KD64_9DINO
MRSMRAWSWVNKTPASCCVSRRLRTCGPLVLRSWRTAPPPVGQRHIGTSWLVTRVAEVSRDEVSVADVLAFLQSEIHGTLANTPAEAAERIELMVQADLDPDDRIRLEDAEEMLHELGVDQDRLMDFLVKDGKDE